MIPVPPTAAALRTRATQLDTEILAHQAAVLDSTRTGRRVPRVQGRRGLRGRAAQLVLQQRVQGGGECGEGGGLQGLVRVSQPRALPDVPDPRRAHRGVQREHAPV